VLLPKVKGNRFTTLRKAKWPHVTSVRPLSVRTAEGIRTRYTSLSWRDALSIELQRYAAQNLSQSKRLV
jgi:hypothetical protein